jgi:hypothetical protein
MPRSVFFPLLVLLLFAPAARAATPDGWSLAIFGDRLSPPASPSPAPAAATAPCAGTWGEACSSPTLLGTLCGDQGQDQVVVNGCGSAWFQFRLAECNLGLFGADLLVRIQLSMVGATDYDLYVYDDCVSAPVASTLPGTLTDVVAMTIPDQLGVDDSRVYIVEVRLYGGAGVGDPPAWRGTGPLSVESDPNPTRGDARIRYSLPRAGWARVTILDASGARIRSFDEGLLPAGPHQLMWDGRDASGRAVNAGVYFARVEGPGSAGRAKLVLVR